MSQGTSNSIRMQQNQPRGPWSDTGDDVHSALARLLTLAPQITAANTKQLEQAAELEQLRSECEAHRKENNYFRQRLNDASAIRLILERDLATERTQSELLHEERNEYLSDLYHTEDALATLFEKFQRLEYLKFQHQDELSRLEDNVYVYKTQLKHMIKMWVARTGEQPTGLREIAGNATPPPKAKNAEDDQLQASKKRKQELRKQKEKNGEVSKLQLPDGKAPPNWGDFDPERYINAEEEALEGQEALRAQSPVRVSKKQAQPQVQIQGSGSAQKLPNFTAKSNQMIFPAAPARHPEELTHEEWLPPSPRKTTSSTSPNQRIAVGNPNPLPVTNEPTVPQATPQVSTSRSQIPQAQASMAQVPAQTMSAKEAMRHAEILATIERHKDRQAYNLIKEAQARAFRRDVNMRRRLKIREKMMIGLVEFRDDEEVDESVAEGAQEEPEIGDTEVVEDVTPQPIDANSNERYVIVARGPTIEIAIPNTTFIKTEAEEVNLANTHIVDDPLTAARAPSAEEPRDEVALERESESPEAYEHPHHQATSSHSHSHSESGTDVDSMVFPVRSTRRKSKYGERDAEEFVQDGSQSGSTSDESEPPPKKRKPSPPPRQPSKRITAPAEKRPTRAAKQKAASVASGRAKTSRATVNKPKNTSRPTQRPKGVSVHASTDADFTGDDEIVLRDERSPSVVETETPRSRRRTAPTRRR